MAFIDDDNQKKKDGDEDAGGSYIGSGGEGGPGTTAKPTESGSYTNLMDYIGANQGNDATMGQAVRGTVNQTGQGANAAMDTMGQEASSAIQAGTGRVDQAQMDAINKGTGVDQATISDIGKGLIKTAPVIEYKGPNSIDASYNGPQDAMSINGALETQQSVQNTQQMANMAGNQPGVSTLLRKTYNNPSYNSGENNLDTFLTQSGQGGQAELQGIGQDWGGITNKMNDKFSGINSQIGAAKDASNAATDAYGNAIKGAKENVSQTNAAYGQAISDKKARDAEEAKKTANPVVFQSPMSTPAKVMPAPQKVKNAEPISNGQAMVTPTPNSGPIANPTQTGANNPFFGQSGVVSGVPWAAHGGKVPERFAGIRKALRK